MPAIRGYSWNQNATATNTTIVIPTPAYQQNDLLVAVICADTGAGTWSSAGWTVLTTLTNTCQMAILYKIAGASEAASFTFTSTVAETYNGFIVSIEDVNTTTPFGSPDPRSVVTQAAATRFALPSITTNVANSLVLYAAAISNVGIPSIIEGPVTTILGADGSAESLAVAWGFKPTTGATPTNVFCSFTGTTGNGVKAALQIAPPSGGAVVIPAYCSADPSTYVDPLNGTTAFNTNTALAATADTNFATTLGGITADDATVAAGTDYGINSFHSVGRLTNTSGTQNYSGAALVPAVGNRPNVTGKNVMVHTGPSTPGQIQRLNDAANRGMMFGMRSSAGNYKTWKVHGAGTPWGAARDVPLIIHPNALDPVANVGTLAPAAIDAFGFWVAGSGVTTTVWDFYMLWVLDTVTVAGGNAARPVGIPGIVSAAALGHERFNVIQQGASQALILGPVQIGDGGTNPVYLDLDSTAIEFPEQRNPAKLAFNYNSVDNVCGLAYHGGSSDTIKHRNSVISSPSKYHWRIRSGAAGTYDFTGLAIIGAGDVQLRDITAPAQFTYSEMTFNKCGQIVQNSAYLDNCVITSSVATSAILSTTPNRISNCSFVRGATGHAIEITTPGTYTFTGNTFSGYGAAGSTDAAIYNNSGGAVTLNVVGGGTTPTVRNEAGASTTVNSNVSVTMTGLVDNTEVRVYSAGTTTELAGTDAAVDGTTNDRSFTFSVGSGTAVDIRIHAIAYEHEDVLGYSTLTDASIPVKQRFDRNYENL